METSKSNTTVVEIHTRMISTNLGELIASMSVCDLKMQALQPLFRGEAICQGTMPINSPLHTDLISNNPLLAIYPFIIISIKRDIFMQLLENPQGTISIIFILIDHTQEDLLKSRIILPFSLISDTVQSANDRVRIPAEMVAILKRFFFQLYLMYPGKFEKI